MVSKKAKKSAPVDGAETAANLQAAWPFPTSSKKSPPAAAEEEAVDPVAERDDFRGDFDAHNNATNPAAGERVRVDAIDLYTDPSLNVIERLPLEQLLESPFNPRTRYDEAALRELSETIRDVGVMQALLVRPISMPDGWEIRRGDELVQPYEIVFGHRRYRAARLAGVVHVPVIKRTLTDAQAAQLQAIENVQREDLDPVEEARGYAHYIKVHGVSKDQLATEIGLSRTHVYSRLKLATAASAVLDAMRAGEIYEENALRIARLPSEKLQLKALETLRKDYKYDPEDGGKRSVRRIQEFLRERFTLQLRDAIFDTKDATLLELAGACTGCPKRSGNAPEFADLANDTEKDYGNRHLRAGPDLCTDPDCFEAKKKAHLVNKAAELTAKGKTVITGGKARSAISAEGKVKGAYIELKDVKTELAKNGKKAGVDVPIVTIQNPRDGKTKEAVAIAELVAAGVLKKAPTHSNSGGAAQNRKYEEENRKRQAKAAMETKVNYAVLMAVRTAAAGQPLTTLALQLVTLAAFKGVEWDDREALAKLHNFKSDHELEKKIGQMAPDRLATLLLDCALIENVESNGYDGEHYKPNALLAAAKHYGVDVAALRKEVAKQPTDKKTKALPLEEEQDEEEAAQA